MRKSIAYGGFMIGLLSSVSTFSQYAADAFRYSESYQTGTARFQALGGNHVSIGGDASSMFGNPAGLGFYNRSEFSISPALTSVNNKTNYIGDANSASKANFNIGQAALIFTSQPGFQRKWKRSSFGVAYSRQQSFNETYRYTGLNNKSAYIDKVVEDANRNGGIPLKQFNADFEPGGSNSGPLAFSVPAAYYEMYLLNPTSQDGPPYNALDNKSATEQAGSYTATGGNSQWTLSYAGNYNDKFYIGGSLGFNRIKYTYDRVFNDNYVNSPDLINVQHNERLEVKGNGVNISLGVIYKLNPTVQLGGVITSPTWSSLKETFHQGVGATFVDGLVMGPDDKLIKPDYDYIPVAPNDFVYRISSPLKGSFGATYFIKNSGFLTASLDYIGYAAMRANTSYLNAADNKSFKDETNLEIKDTYRNTVNARIGGEFRAGYMRGRLGFAYIADPYVDRNNIDRSKILFSAGVGYRNDRFFTDLTGTYTMYKSGFTPYSLNNAADYSSVQINTKAVNVMLTMGVFF